MKDLCITDAATSEIIDTTTIPTSKRHYEQLRALGK
jgi:hypothetical protein